MTITMNYPVVNFRCFLNPVHQYLNKGLLIGDLYVGWTNNLYQSVTIYNAYGYPVVPVRFKTQSDAVQVAELLNQHYSEYYILWYDNPQADVPLLTRYTIPNGEALYSTIKQFDGQVIAYDEFINEYTRFNP